MLGDSMRRRRTRAQPSSPRAPSFRWRPWLVALLAAVPLGFGAGYAVAAFVLFPAPEVAAGDVIAVPRLVGRTLAEAERELAELGLAVGEVTKLSHPGEAAGVVLAQSPLPGQLLRSGAGVDLSVSTGRSRAKVPDLVGLPAADAAALLERLGFSVSRRDELSPGAGGAVVRVEPAPGTEQELPGQVVLVVGIEPPTLEVPQAVAPGFDGMALPARPDTGPELVGRPWP
jgi:serine/threonine-protein kinase